MGTFPLSVKRRGNNILIRWCDEEGVRGRQKVKFSPTLYMKNPNSAPSGITNVFNENLDPIPFETMKDANEFIDRYKNTPGAGVYGINNYITQFMTQVYPDGYRIDPHLVRGAYLDIEVFSGSLDSTGNVVAGPFPDAENAKFPINAITVYASHHKKFFTWAINPKYLFEMKDNPQFKYDDQYGLHLESSDIDYREFKNESELLRNFLSWWSAQEFDFWTGWNIESFDCPYIVHRAQKVLSDSWANMLSPWDILNKRTVKSAWKEYTTYDFVGCEMLDMLDVYKKHTFKIQTSYKLGHIAFVECGEKKIDYKEARNLNKLYLMDYNKFIHYNINDVRVTKLIDEKVGLMNITMVLAEIARINFADTLGSIKPWSSILDTAFWKRGQVMEVKQIKQARDFEGGYVKDPVRGRHKWIVSIDLNSEYPHVRQQYNIGPETFISDYKLKRQIIGDLVDEIKNDISKTSDVSHRRLLNKLMVAIDTECSNISDILTACQGLVKFDALKKYNVAMTANVNFFKKDRMSIYNELDRKFYDTRSKEKKLMKAFEQDRVLIKEELHHREQFNKSSNFVEQTVDELFSRMPGLGKKIARQDGLQMAYKILLNSGYGAVSNPYFVNYFEPDIAEGITTSGQLINKWTEKSNNEFLNAYCGTEGVDYVIYCDTDSQYLCMDNIVKMNGWENLEIQEIVDKLDEFFTNVLQPEIDRTAQLLCDTVNGWEQRMFWDREIIAESSMFIQKKRYAALVYDSEGVRYHEPKMKVMGLDSKKSTTPLHCQKWLNECYKLIMEFNDNGLRKRVKEIRKEFMSKSIEQIAKTQSANNLEKWFDPETIFKTRTPGHVRAALVHNFLVQSLNLENEIPLIESGEKIMHVRLKPTNPLKVNSIGFVGNLPKEFKIDDFVDYKEMYNKSFKNALENVTNPLNIPLSNTASLASFFQKQ